MANSVTKAELVSRIANDAGLKKVQAERALAAVTTAIQDALVGGKKVAVRGEIVDDESRGTEVRIRPR